MNFVKIPVAIGRDPRIAPVGPYGIALHVCATAYCGELLTDGFVPYAVVESLINLRAQDMTADMIASALEATGLWRHDEELGGWWLEDFFDFNSSRAEVEDKLTTERERKRRARLKRKTDADATAGQSETTSDVRSESARNPADVRSTDVDVDVELPSVINRKKTQAAETLNEKSTPVDAGVAQVLAEVLPLLVEEDLKLRRQSDTRPIRDPAAWRAEALAVRTVNTSARIAELHEAFPEWPPRRISRHIIASERGESYSTVPDFVPDNLERGRR